MKEIKVQLNEKEFILPEISIQFLENAFEKINKKRLKLIEKGRIPENFPELSLQYKAVDDELLRELIQGDKLSDAEKVRLSKYAKNHVVVSISNSELPNLNNWYVLGILEKNPETSSFTLTSFNPDNPIPNEYREADPCQCDHCGHSRRRNSTFIIKNSLNEEIMQVGKSCMKDFINKQELEMLMFYSDARTMLSDFDPEDAINIGAPFVFSIGKKNYLAACNAIMRQTGGFVSAKNADIYEMNPSTSIGALHITDPFALGSFLRYEKRYASTHAKELLEQYNKMITSIKPNDEDYQKVEESIQWFIDNPPKEDDNEFYWNMHSIMTNDAMFLHKGENGRVCYAIEYVNKQKEAEQNVSSFLNKKRQSLKTPKYLGCESVPYEDIKADKILELEVRLTGAYVLGSIYGDCAVYNFETRDGRKVQWKASDMGRPDCFSYEDYPYFADIRSRHNKLVEDGKSMWMTIKGTIKKNEEYTNKKGYKVHQTVLRNVNSTSDVHDMPFTNGFMHYNSKYKLDEFKVEKINKGTTFVNNEEQYCYKLTKSLGEARELFSFEKLEGIEEGQHIRMPVQSNGKEIVGIFPASIEKIDGFTEDFEPVEMTRNKASKYNQKPVRKPRKPRAKKV